jgi:DNA methylase
VLAPHGSIAVELGDTYSGSGGAGGDYGEGGWRGDQEKFAGSALMHRKAKVLVDGKRLQQGPGWPLAKSLCGIPTLYGDSLAYGRNLLDPDDRIDPWRIRNRIVWHRPNPPVGALGDKVRPSTSYITVATVATDRWFDLDAERTPHTKPNGNGMMRAKTQSTGSRADDGLPFYNEGHSAGAPPLDCWDDPYDPADLTWTIPTQPYKGSHYATWPIRLASRLINLMCPRQVCLTCGQPRRRITGEPEYVSNGRVVAPHVWQSGIATAGAHSNKQDGNTTRTAPTLGWSDCGHDNFRNGITLDPFAGSGTTLAAASGLGRDSIGIDLDPANLDLARARVGMFLEETA